MDVRSDIFPDTPDGFHPRDVSVRLARPDGRIRWDRLMDQHHYLGFKRFASRGVRYVFEWRGQWVGLAGWQSGAFKCRPRDQWIGWKRELQFTRMHLITNNTRFLILGARGCFPNLASLALAAMVQRLSADWSAAYGHSLRLAETFVDPSKFCGYMYKEAGWTRLGKRKAMPARTVDIRTRTGFRKTYMFFRCTAIQEVVCVPRILFPTPCCQTRWGTPQGSRLAV